MSSLHKVLREYSVPLQIWLAPDARAKIAETITLRVKDQVRGESFLVLGARGGNEAAQAPLKVRVVLLKGRMMISLLQTFFVQSMFL